MPGHGDFTPRFVGVNFNVVAHTVGRVQTYHAVGHQPPPLNQPVEHAFGIGIDTHSFSANNLVFQNRRKRPCQVPGLEKRCPVDEFGQLGQVKIFKNPAANELGHRRRVVGPIHHCRVGARFGQRPHWYLLFVGVLQADFFIVAVQLVNVFGCMVTQQALRHANTARRIGHINHRAFIMRRDLDGRVDTRARCAANQQRNFFYPKVVVFLHFGGHVLHFLKAGRDQTTQAHNIGLFNFGTCQNFVAWHHHAHVDHFKVVALQHHRHNVFANVMHIALDGGNDDFSLGFDIAASSLQQQLFSFDVRQ